MKIQLSDHFTTGRLLRFVFPSIIMMAFTSIYGVVDGFFVSNFAGKTAFASVNLIMPFIMITSGLGFMFGTGGSALVSMKLGQGEKEKANQYFSMIVIATCVLGGILSILGYIFTPQVARLLGATDDMMQDCVLYGRINMAFNVPFMLQYLFQTLFITAEKPKLGLYTTVVSGVSNMILDYILVGLIPLGVTGAAAATAVSQCIGGFFPLVYFIRKNDSLLQLVPTKLEATPILKAAGNGSSELMSNISSSLVSMLYNLQLMKYFGENGVATNGVLMYVQFIFVAIYMGYTIGSSPIVSYHYGAENTKEVQNLFKKSYLLIISAGVILTLTAKLAAPIIASIFVGYDAELQQLTEHAFSLYSYMFLPAGFNILTSSFFTALNNGKISAGISFMRTLLFQSSAILILPLLLGKDGIWLSALTAEIFALVVSLYFLIRCEKDYHYFPVSN